MDFDSVQLWLLAMAFECSISVSLRSRMAGLVSQATGVFRFSIAIEFYCLMVLFPFPPSFFPGSNSTEDKA